MIQVPDSKRLKFRLLLPNQDTADLLFELDQDPEVMRFITNGEPTSMEDIHNIYIPRLASYTRPERGWGMWGVFSQLNDAFLGWILVRPMHFFSDAKQENDLELGWRFKRATWGNGIATEAAHSVMNELIKYKLADYFSAIAVKENYASIAIMKKLGMKYIKSGIHSDPLGDMLVDTFSRPA